MSTLFSDFFAFFNWTKRGKRDWKTELITKSGPPDRQQETPAAWCCCCYGEIYQGEDCYRIDGQIVCTDCLSRFAQDYFRLYRLRGGF